MALAVEEDAVGPSTMPEPSRRPGKKPMGMEDSVEGRAGTPSDQMENGAGGRGGRAYLQVMEKVVKKISE
ncbi:uncharacterized protein A4U43_C04F11530 [Asparagus officinalis]|uniref:Uncharacterized protein n=1 Tax=Asparagus officinalis TaxID=4686 RepID=A0A5P1F2S8_ASPOF|nr:uncharacterized protein A4U43_C04F11530 [Asparagus officinalis]